MNIISIEKENGRISIHIEANPSYIVSTAVAWIYSDFKDYNKKIDLSSFLDQSDETEEFILAPSDLGLDNLNTLIFFEFESSEEPLPGTPFQSNVKLGVFADLSNFNKKIINSALRVEVKNCNLMVDSCNKENSDEILAVIFLKEGLQEALLSGDYSSAVKIFDSIDQYSRCEDCNSEVDVGTGYGFGTENNDIIIL